MSRPLVQWLVYTMWRLVQRSSELNMLNFDDRWSTVGASDLTNAHTVSTKHLFIDQLLLQRSQRVLTSFYKRVKTPIY